MAVMDNILDRQWIVETLRRHHDELAAMGVRSLRLFGSAARNELMPGSDIDILVDFATPPGFRGYVRVKTRLEQLLGREVDLVMKQALTPRARKAVAAEMIDVA